MSKTSSEVPALISAVLEYKKFRQLACYSIECVTKVIAPINRDYKKNLQIAFSAQAPKCIVEVLSHHIGKEDCLLVCVDCLHKLAVDDDNAEAIAREGGVRAVLTSIGAIPTIEEDTLCEAMAILDTLCNHQRALEILADMENVGAVIDLVKKRTASSRVKVNCMRALDKLTRLPTGVDSFLRCNGIPELLVLISDYKTKCISGEFDEVDLETMTTATKILLRLCKHSSAVVDDLISANGAETFVNILDSLTDLPLGHLHESKSGEALDTKDCLFSRLAGKLISKMYEGRISELVKSLKNSSQLNEFTLNLLGSLAMDSSSSLGIVSNGGIEILLLGCQGSTASTKILEVSTRALSRLAGNVSNIEGLVQQGGIQGLIGALVADHGSLASVADAILGLTLLCSTGEYAEQVCGEGGLPAVLTCVTALASYVNEEDELKRKEIIMTGLSFLEQIASANNVDGGEVQTSLLLSMSKDDVYGILTIISNNHSDLPLVTKALRVLTAYVKANPAHGLLNNDGSHTAVMPLVVALLSEHAMFNESETTSASDSAVALVDELLSFLCSILLIFVPKEVESRRRDSVTRASQSRLLDQQGTFHSTPSWKAAVTTLVSEGDNIVNLAMSGYLERTSNPTSVDTMDSFRMYSAASLSHCRPLIALFAIGGPKGSTSPIPALVALIAAFSEQWASGNVDENTLTDTLPRALSAVTSLGLFASVDPSHPALAMLASERVIEQLLYLLYTLMTTAMPASVSESEHGAVVGALVSATCLSAVHCIGGLYGMLHVAGDDRSNDMFLNLLGDPLMAAQLCVDVMKSPAISTMTTSLQALRLLMMLNRIAREIITPHLIEIGGIEALVAVLKATGPLAAAAANSVQADIGMRTVVTVVHIIAHLFDEISQVSGAIDGACELSRRGGAKISITAFVDSLGSAQAGDRAGAVAGDNGEDMSANGGVGGGKDSDDRSLGYGLQCAEAALLFLYALERVALLGEAECSILSKLGAVVILFRLCDRFEDNLDIFDATNRIVQLLVAPSDMLLILQNISTKYSPSVTISTIFGAKCTSDGMERAIRDVDRLCHFMGLLPMVEAFVENGGIGIIQSCISNMVTAIADARGAKGSVELLQLRGNFLNACVRVLCRGAATGLLNDITDGTVKLVCDHLLAILKKANQDSRAVDFATLLETLQSIVRLSHSLPAAASVFYSGGAVGQLVKRMQISSVDSAGGGKMDGQFMELSVNALSTISHSCPFTYDYLLSTAKLIQQICACITDYVVETGGIALPPWITLAVSYLSKIFQSLHETCVLDAEAICGQGNTPSVALLFLVLRTTGSDLFSVLLSFKGSHVMNSVKPSTHAMDILSNLLLASLDLQVSLTEEDFSAIAQSYGNGDLATATCYGLCTSLLTTEVTAIPKCTQLLRRVWLASGTVAMQDDKKRRDLDAQMKSYLALLRAFAGTRGGRYAALNTSIVNEKRKLLNQFGVNKLLISILSGEVELSEALRENVEATLSLLSEEDYGENALQTFAEYITTLATGLTAPAFLECTTGRILGTLAELGEGEENDESNFMALQKTVKLLQRFLQRGTEITDENVAALAVAAQLVVTQLYEIASVLETSSGQLNKLQLLEMSDIHGSVLEVAVQALNILLKLLTTNYALMPKETLCELFDFDAALRLATEVLAKYISILEAQHSDKSKRFQESDDVSEEILRACLGVTTAICQLCADTSGAQMLTTSGVVLHSGLALSLHKISSAIAIVPSDLRSSAVVSLDCLHDALMASAEVMTSLFPMPETQDSISWRMCDMNYTSVQSVQAQRRSGCVSWVHVACGTDALVQSILTIIDLIHDKELDSFCGEGAASLYRLDLSGAIGYLLHSIADYNAQGVPLPISLPGSIIDLVQRYLKDDETLFDLLAHNACGPAACEQSVFELAQSQSVVNTLVQALVVELKAPVDRVSGGNNQERIKYNQTVSLAGLTKMVGVAAANPSEAGSITAGMMQAGILDVIHDALSSPAMNSDEDLVQSLMYILCTLVELGLVDLADMPKDTRKMILNLLIQFPENAYLANISSSMFQSLTEMFSKGPEAELEALYQHIITLQASLGTVVELRDAEQNKCYYYDQATGESSWAVNSYHMELLQDLDTAILIIEGPLKGDVSNTSFTEDVCGAFLAILNSHYHDARVLGRLLRLVEAQMAVEAQRDLYGRLDLAGSVQYDMLVYSKLDRAWDIASAKIDATAMAVNMLHNLSHIQAPIAHLSQRDYIIFLNTFCLDTVRAAVDGKEELLLKAESTLANLCQKNEEVIAICFEIGVPGTIAEIASSQWVGSALQLSLRCKAGSGGQDSDTPATFESIIRTIIQMTSSLMAGSKERRVALCTAVGSAFLTALDYLSVQLKPPAPSADEGSMGKKKQGVGVIISNDAMLLLLLKLLGIFSSNDSCAWYMLHKLPTVEVLTSIAVKHLHLAKIITPCLNILANLASVEFEDGALVPGFDSSELLPQSCAKLARGGGVDLCVSAMKRHPRNVDVIAAGSAVLLNACPEQEYDEDGNVAELSADANEAIEAYVAQGVCGALITALEFCVGEEDSRPHFTENALATAFIIVRLLSMLTMSNELLTEMNDGDVSSALVQILVDILKKDLVSCAEADASENSEGGRKEENEGEEENLLVASLQFLLILVQSSHHCLNTLYMCAGDIVEILVDLLTRNMSFGLLVQTTLSLMGYLAQLSEVLSKEIAESGMSVFMGVVQSRLLPVGSSGDQNSMIVSAVFAVLSVLVSSESNIRPLIRVGGFDLLIRSLSVYMKDPRVMMSAIVTLDLIATAEDEYLMVFLQKGGVTAVKKVVAAQEQGSDVHQAASSLLLALTARERLLMSSGSKTSRGALLARLKDGLEDVDKMMHLEEIVSTKVEMVDPTVLKKHRNIMKAGQIIIDYTPPTDNNGRGGGNAIKRHMQLSSDFETLAMKDIVKKSIKGGRRIPLRNLRVVTAGLGPGHYQRMLTGKLKPVAQADRSFYITSIKPEDAMYIECQTELDRDRWVAAISAYLIAYRHQFEELKEIMST